MSSKIYHPHSMTNTHILLHDFEYFEPASVEETLLLLQQYGDSAQILAGGTHLLVQMKMEKLTPACVINICRLSDLEGFSVENGHILIGACTTIRACRNQADIQESYSALSDACDAFGSTQIQDMGTIGGNLCIASPASDTVPALMTFDAQLQVMGIGGSRQIAVENFLLEPRKTTKKPTEILTGILLPKSKANTGSAFIKISRVKADLAKASAAAVVVRKGNRIAGCRIALGSVAPTVIRARGAEAILAGQTFNSEIALKAAEIASEEITPIDDIRSSAWYRHQVVRALIHDVLQVAWERAGDKHEPGHRTTSGCKIDAKEKPMGSIQIKPHGKYLIQLIVNGEKHALWVAANELLLNVLRERLQLTGSKYSCGIGECGACTVLINGLPALACLVLAISIDGCRIQTVEGLQKPDGSLDSLQKTLIEEQGFQCGYCTPGILMITRSLLDEIPYPTEDDVRDYLRGNRCRCTGFTSIVRAVMKYVGEYSHER